LALDRQHVVEARKESPNHVVGEEGHVNSWRILWPSERTSPLIQTSGQRGVVHQHMQTQNHTAYHIQFGGWFSGPSYHTTTSMWKMPPSWLHYA